MKTIAIAGASGFVGQSLVKLLATQEGEELQLIALSRSTREGLPPKVAQRQVDLFSAQSTVQALQGVDTAIYLVHSMMPSSQLFQGDFHDTDLLLADNFAHACVANGVKHIIYLGGMAPEGYTSKHLQSRLEVEETFRSTGIPFTALRAGMIVGPGGSSFEILQNLVEHLPVMILPAWTQRATQAVFIDDVVSIIRAAIEDPRFQNQIVDVVNGESLHYQGLLEQMAVTLEVRRVMLPVPIQSTGFSKLWVTLFGNSTFELVSPLIDSLLCDLPQTKPSELIQNLIRYPTFQSMVKETLKRQRTPSTQRPKRKLHFVHSVRSIQRLPQICEKNCDWIAREYLSWLPRFFSGLIQVRFNPAESQAAFHIGRLPWPLLTLRYIPSAGGFEEDRQKFHIVGGLLSKTENTGWLEFRQVNHRKYTLAAIHEFIPALPWPIYVLTQAPLHRYVMNAFGKHLSQF